MENKPNQTLRIAIVSIAALALAFVLIKILLTYTQIKPPELLGDIQDLPTWLLAAVIMGMLFNIMLGAQNWRLTVEHVSTSNKQNYLFYLTYSTMSAVIGLFIPVQISNLIIRSLSLKLLGNASAQKSTITALVSQIHDVSVSMAFLIPGMLVIFGKANPSQWLLFEFLLIAGMYLLVSRYTFGIVQKISSLKFQNKVTQKVLSLLKEGLDVGLFDNSLMVGLYRNSLLKFLILALRVYLISVTLGLATSFTQIASIFSVLQISIIFTITPGNLGVIEWGWVGLLSQIGISTYAAGNFALVSRILGYASTIAALFSVLTIFGMRKLSKKFIQS